MIMRTLGRTGMSVSALGLGGFQFTAQFGVAPQEADNMIDYALAHGVNLMDTAQIYGAGESEAIIGRALARHKDNKPYVCAKVGHFQDTGILSFNKEKAMQAYHNYDEIMRTIKHSLWLLREDHFDILMLHEAEREWNVNFPSGDCVIMDVLEDLKKQGVVKAIGASSWDCSTLAKLIRTDRIDTVLVAGGISLLTRWMFDELVPAAKEHNVGVIIGGVLGQNTPGLVVKDRNALVPFKESDDVKLNVLAQKLECLYDLADELDLTMVQMAVRYALSFPDIHSHTMGARELAHVKDNIRSAEMGPLPAEAVARINQIQDAGDTFDFSTIVHKRMENLLKD
ncbi:MAG: aldo/keto reductase [Oscillibacter sp.]|nr:aldo/keto reductase [Oscillibacter sp.]